MSARTIMLAGLLASAPALATQGAKVAIAGPSLAKADALADAMNAEGHEAIALQLDARSVGAIETVVGEADQAL